MIHPATDAYAEITGDRVDNDRVFFFNVRFRCQREGSEMVLFRCNKGRLLYAANSFREYVQ